LEWRLRLTSNSQQADKHQKAGDKELEAIDASAVVVESNMRVSSDTPPDPVLPLTGLTYWIPKHPLVHNATVNNITTLYHAGFFLDALNNYLLSAAPSASSVSPLLNTRFNLYKQLSIPIGYLPAVAQGTSNWIRAALLATPSRSWSANVG
jgi:hypothetical protein